MRESEASATGVMWIGSRLRSSFVSRFPRRHRAAADRHRAVPAGPADHCAEPAPLLLRDLDRIEAAAGDVDGGAAELTERVARAAADVRVLLGEELRAQGAAVLLVAQDRKDEAAPPFRVRAQERRHEHGDAALHVERSATPDVAVDEVAAKRRVRPPLAGGGDDVDVPVEDERRSVCARKPGEEIRPARLLLVAAAVDAGCAEQRLDVRDAPLLVAGRVRRVEPEQLPQELDRIRDHRDSSASSSRSISSTVL
jgi:hypothetical protein